MNRLTFHLTYKYWWWVLLIVLAGCDSNAQAVQTVAPATIAAPGTSVALTTIAAPVATAVSTPVALPGPAAFQVTARPADTQVQLTWPAVARARGYYVYRDGSATPLNATPIVEPQYSDIGLTNGRSHTYQVAAQDQAGIILARSATLSATPKAP